MKVSESLKEKLPFIRICKKCRVLGRSMLYWKKKRCMLCGSLTKKYKFKSVDTEETVVTKLQSDQKILEHIQDRTNDFDCPGTVTKVIHGPVVTEYEFTPDRYTRINKLKSLNEDLAISLGVEDVSIRRIPGKSCIGIAIPNKERNPVTYQSCVGTILKNSEKMDLPLNFGIMADGSPYIEDLTKYPHLLIGGATGTGKSVLLNQLLTNLLLVRSPKQLRLVLIDPKQVELFPYKDIPHLLMEPEKNVWRVIGILEDAIKTMKSRMDTLHRTHVSSIKEYNDMYKSKAEEFLKEGKKDWARVEMDKCWPHILVVIDELSEIVLEEKKEFVVRMASISQMARAAGISVIAATQRPSVDVLPGKIKVNFLARAAFRMPSPQDSKTVLNFKGAESLLGKGDLFVLSPDKTGLQRVHVAHCTKEDRNPVLQRVIELGYDDDGMLKDYPSSKEKSKSA